MSSMGASSIHDRLCRTCTWLLLNAYAQALSLHSNHETSQAQELGSYSEKHVSPLPGQAVWTVG